MHDVRDDDGLFNLHFAADNEPSREATPEEERAALESMRKAEK